MIKIKSYWVIFSHTQKQFIYGHLAGYTYYVAITLFTKVKGSKVKLIIGRLVVVLIDFFCASVIILC